MAEYLTKEEVVQELYKVSHRLSDPPIDKAELETIKELHSIMHKIEQMPAADVVEVKHGYWKLTGRKLTCSVCGHKAYIGTDDKGLLKEEADLHRYCFHCGAKMDGKSGADK